MRDYKKSANPFYALLVITGIVFAITATAYGVMAVTEARAGQQANAAQQPAHPLIEWMSRHGNTALLAELAFLAAFTIGAIGTDDYWQRRAAAERKRLHAKLASKPERDAYVNDQFQALVDEDRRARPLHDETTAQNEVGSL